MSWKLGITHIFVSINKTIWQNTATAIHIGIICDYFCAITAKLSNCHREHTLKKPEIFTIWSYTEKAHRPCCRVKGIKFELKSAPLIPGS